MMNYTALELSDFSGGMTDYPFSAPPNKAETLDNFYIDPNDKLLQRPGSELAQDTTPQLTTGEVRINKLIAHDVEDIYYVGEGKKIHYPNNLGGFTELVGVGGVDAFSAGVSGGFSSFAEWNKHWLGVSSEFALPIKIYKDEYGVPQVRTAGLPKFATNPTITPVAGALSYIWYFIYKFEYKVGDTTFIDLSAPIFVQKTNAAEPTVVNPAVITNIPVLANSGGSSYDLTKITKQIYRTAAGGTTAFFVAEITNATTSYNDITNDASVVLNEPLYTTGGVLTYDTPTPSKFIHIMDGTAYYAFTKEGTEYFPSRIRQSIPGDPDSVPLDLYVDIRDTITGISSYKSRVVVFGEQRIFRIDGQFDELGRNGMLTEEISKITGCISHDSIVQTEIGVFFAGNSGFYWTDGYEVKKVSDSINERYKTMLSLSSDTRRIQGAYDAFNLKVYWTFQQESDVSDNDCIFCLDLRKIDLNRKDGAYTRWLNEGVFNPCAIMIYKNELYRADFYGYTYRHGSELAVDPLTDNLKSPSDWDTKTIIWDFKTIHLNFGLPSVRKWVAQILLSVRNYSNISIQPYSINDDGSAEDALKDIRFRDSLVWGDPEPTWGDPNLAWNFQGLIEQKRRFPAGGLRCSYKQVRLTNAYTVVTNSDAYCPATLDRVTKEVVLDDLALSWIPNLLGYDLVIKPNGGVSPAGYDLTLPIASRDSNTQITLSDPTDRVNNEYPAADGYDFDSVQWLIKGYPKNEIANLMSLVIYYAPLTPTQRTFYGTKSETGNNA